MEKVFKLIFGQSFQSVVELVQSMDTLQQIIFIFWVGCVVMFYSTFLYIIYLIGKDVVSKLLLNLKSVK
jgi:uncharacterized membrane protein YczE